MKSIECYSEPDPRSRWQKIKARMFPPRYCYLPEAPPEYKDCIHGTAITKFSWMDRFRVFLTGIVVTEWRCVTENEVGSIVNSAVSYVGTSDNLSK